MAKSPYDCPVEATARVAFGKWKPIIVHHLLDRPHRFGELQKAIRGVTQRSLTMQLRPLEEDGVINRKVFAEVPLKVEYSLTDFGQTLDPVIRAMMEWGGTFIARAALSPSRSDADDIAEAQAELAGPEASIGRLGGTPARSG